MGFRFHCEGPKFRRIATALLLLVACARLSGATVNFAREIQPILSEHCFACHGPDAQARKADLRLDTSEGMLGVGKSGRKVAVPRQAAQSELIRRITTTDPDDVMPPPKSNHRLTAAQVELLQRWVEEGAVWGRHWAFEPVRRPQVPRVSGQPRNPIDAFVWSRLEKEGLKPSHQAPPVTLLRRLSLDLTGLPPSPDEVDAWLRNPSDDAYERAVERGLASPRYGERMAWEWLEAARYADSNGYQGDSERTMWPWRDWVVDAFNRNLPFDQFTMWQVAGDLLPGATAEQRLATGFLRNHAINGEGGRIPEENRIDYLFDQAETVATVWLSATFNCTRCHDHKFDPYTQRDYYGLVAYFNRTSVDGSGGNPQTPPILAVPSAEQSRRLSASESALNAAIQATETFEQTKFPRGAGEPIEASAAVKELPAELKDVLKVPPRDRDSGRLEKLTAKWKETDSQYVQVLEALRRAREERDAVSRGIPRVMVMEDLPTVRPTFILQRGNYLKPGSEVSTSLPACLTTEAGRFASNRLGLAEWLVSPENPLTARVIVNRYWQSFFGVGLVKTAEDFGVQGERPVYPELLDWLASEFMSSGWDLKRLVRCIVTSATYQQTSKVSPELFERDPENRLLARGPRFRQPSWMIRDAALASAGLLTEQLGGAPVKPYQPSGVWEEATFGNKRYEQDHGAALYRRSLYVFWRRIVGPTMFFDVANRQTCTVKTPRTNVPLHALLTMNDLAYLEAARALAERVLLSDERSDDARLARASRWVLGRAPSADEALVMRRALERHRHTYATHPADAAALVAVGESPAKPGLDPQELAAWTVLCSTLLNLDETLTKE